MEKNDMSLPTVLYPEIVRPSETGGKNVTTKKIAIVSVSVVVSLVLMLGSLLLTIHLVSDKDKSAYVKEKTITFKDENGKHTKEKIYVNTKTNEEAFETSKISVVQDFEKSLTVIRVKGSDNKYLCYLTTLNSTGMMNPDQMEQALSSMDDGIEEPEDDKKNERDEMFKQTAVEVNNRGFLSPKAKSMCVGYTIYWLIPTGEKNGEVDGHRQKRQWNPEFCIFSRGTTCYILGSKK